MHNRTTSAFSTFVALIVASRLHGFNRSVKDVVKVVRLSHSTIMQRLVDFGKTASSKLTVDEFNKIDLEEEADPPSFTKARQRAKQAQIYDESVKYAAPELLAQLASTQEHVEAVLAKRKIIEDDIANRATILPSAGERKKMLKSRLPVRALNYMESNLSPAEDDCSNSDSITSAEIPLKDGVTGKIATNSQSDSSPQRLASNGSVKALQKELKEKELLDTIALFNETQQDFENEDDDIDNNDSNLGSDVMGDSDSKLKNDSVQKKEGEKPLSICTFNVNPQMY